MPLSKKMVTDAIRAAALQTYMEENRQRIEKYVRAAALEKAIVAALKKHKATLRKGDYMHGLGKKGACVCAVGAALLTRAETAERAKELEERVLKHADRQPFSSIRHYYLENRQDIMKWAAKVVDEGISADDLKQLESGFEYNEEDVDPPVEPDEDSPFYQLGRKLAKRAKKARL